MVWKEILKRTPVGRAVARLSAPDPAIYGEAGPDGKRTRTFQAEIPRIPAEELEIAYRRSGLFWKGINRKARDVFKKGFTLVPDDENPDTAKELNAAVAEWMRNTSYRSRAIRAIKEAFVFGDGFLERDFGDDGEADEAPPADAEIVAVWNIDPLSMRPAKNPDTGRIDFYLQGDGVREIPRRDIERWLRGEAELRDGIVAIHPDRIQHFQPNTLRDDPDGYGISVIEAGYINALAKMMGDRAAGDILEWYAQGFFVLNIEFGTPEELDEALKMLEKAKAERRNYFVGSERSKFDIKTPSLGNSRPFYEQFYIEIAAALEMPVMVLTGVQKGTVTGSSSDLIEYNDDVLSFQEVHLEEPMYAMLRRVLHRDDFTIKWTPLYVDKQTEANLRFKDGQSAVGYFGAGLLTKRQAIHFARTGELPDPKSVPDEYVTTPAPTKRSDDPEGGNPEDGEEAPPATERRGATEPGLFDGLFEDDDDEDEDDADPEDEDDESWLAQGLAPGANPEAARIARERSLGKRILAEDE